MLKKIGILVALVFLVGCNDKVRGVLDISKTTGFKDKKGRTVYIPAGSYNSQLKFSKKKAELKIETHQGEQKFKFKHPYKKSQGENFNISLSSRVSGQPVDVDLGRVTTRDYSDKNIYSGEASCRKYVTVGYWETIVRNNKKHRVCKHRRVTARGYEDIQYEKVYKTVQTNIEMYQASTSIYAGGMDATENSVERNIVYRGNCRLSHRPHSECGGRGRGRGRR